MPPVPTQPEPSISQRVSLLVGTVALLTGFRLIIDYSHNRLYAIPDDATIKKPIEKDRIGLVFDKKSTDIFAVAFVAPNSPAEVAGFKMGEKIALIDGKNITE